MRGPCVVFSEISAAMGGVMPRSGHNMTDGFVSAPAPHLQLAQMLRKLARRSSVVRANARAGAEPLAIIRQGEMVATVGRSDFDRARRAGLIEETASGWR